MTPADQRTASLERAHRRLVVIAADVDGATGPAGSLSPIVDGLGRCFALLYEADRSGDAGKLRDALAEVTALGRAAAEKTPWVPALGKVNDACRAVAAELEGLAATDAGPIERSSARELVASTDTPRLHAILRPVLVPIVRTVEGPAPEVLPPPIVVPVATSFEELAAAVAGVKKAVGEPVAPHVPARVPLSMPAKNDRLPALTEQAFVELRARELFEEIAMLGMHRLPQPRDGWRDARVFERRLFASLDALVGLGPVAVQSVQRFVRDAPVADPFRLFAAALSLGCVEGRDALGVVEHLIEVAEPSPETFAAAARALQLAPHPAIVPAMRQLLGDAVAHRRALAVQVLLFREALDVDGLAAFVDDVPEIQAACVVALAERHAPAARAITLARLDHASPLVGRASLRAGLLLGLHDAVDHALRRVTVDDDACLAFGALGFAGGHAALRDAAAASPTSARIEAVGWYGDGAAIPWLVSLLETGDDDTAAAAARALHRITGAPLHEDVAIDDDDIDVAEPPDPIVGEPPRARVVPVVRASADRGDDPEPETATEPTRDPVAWKAYLSSPERRFDAGRRYRLGQLYTPLVTLGEMDVHLASEPVRRALQHELIARTGRFVRFDPADFVIVQEAALAAWLPLATRASSSPGQWVSGALR